MKKPNFPIIHIIGLPGAGKTTLAEKLSKKLFFKKGVVAFFVAAILFCIPGGAGHFKSYAEEESVLSDVSLMTYLNIKQYEYSKEGRNDPFMPPVEQMTAEEEEEIAEQEILAGMRRFEPEQLTLVAILGTDDTKVAMVQDVDGKGYVVSVGTKVGRTGIIQDIVPDRVVIQTTYYTMSGEERMGTVELQLRKGGE